MEIKATLGDLKILVPGDGKKVLFNNDLSATLSHSTNTNARDFTIEHLGGQISSLFINSEGNAEDALVLDASAGGIDILASGADAGEDIDIDADGSSVNITSSEAIADAITLHAEAGGTTIKNTTGGAADFDIKLDVTGGGASKIHLYSTGTASAAQGTNDDGSIFMESTVGGIKLEAGSGKIVTTSTDFDIKATEGNSKVAVDIAGGELTVESSAAGASKLILNSGGVGDDAVAITSPAGGITITPKSDKATENVGTLQVSAAADDGNAIINIYSDIADSRQDADQWRFVAVNDGDLKLQSFQNGASWEDKLTITNLGVVSPGLNFAGNMASDELASENQMVLKSSASQADAVKIYGETNGGALILADGAQNEVIKLNAANSAEAGAITLNAEAGGILAKVADEKTLVLGNAASDAYFKLTASNNPANEII